MADELNVSRPQVAYLGKANVAFLSGGAGTAAALRRGGSDASSRSPVSNEAQNEQATAKQVRERAQDAASASRVEQNQDRRQALRRDELVNDADRDFGELRLQVRNDSIDALRDRGIERSVADDAVEVQRSEELVQRRLDRQQRDREYLAAQQFALRESQRNVESASLDPSAPRGSIVDFEA